MQPLNQVKKFSPSLKFLVYSLDHSPCCDQPKQPVEAGTISQLFLKAVKGYGEVLCTIEFVMIRHGQVCLVSGQLSLMVIFHSRWMLRAHHTAYSCMMSSAYSVCVCVCPSTFHS